MKLKFPVTIAAIVIFSSIYGQSIYENFVDGQLFVRMKANAGLIYSNKTKEVQDGQYEFLEKIKNEYKLRFVKRPFYRLDKPELQRTFHLEIGDYQNIDRLIRKLESMPEVEFAEKVPLDKLLFTPNDGLYQYQWYLKKINAEQAWQYSKGRKDVVVAIVDSGTEIDHPDLKNNIWVNTREIAGNGIDDDNNGYVDDVRGYDVADEDNDPSPPTTSWSHGTHVAGVAGAVTNNSTGIASIGFGIKLMAIKSTNVEAKVSHGYYGIIYAIESGADIINMSFGSNEQAATVQSLMDEAYERNIVLVGGSGNDNVEDVFYPAGYNHVISVGATDDKDRRSNFSNYGSWIDVMAPGSAIGSTVPFGGYNYNSGTSFACPLVAGLCGLMLSANPGLTPDEIESCLLSTAKNIDGINPSYAGKLGAGRIDAAAAMACASATVPSLEVGLTKIYKPFGDHCVSGGVLTEVPEVEFRNFGKQTLTSVKINYQIDNGPVKTLSWTGSLNSFDVATRKLPSVDFSAGYHTYTVFLTKPNGQNDSQSSNDSSMTELMVYAKEASPGPLVEGFEGGAFPPDGWGKFSSNAVAGGWESNSVFYEGSASVKFDNFSVSKAGEVVELITPPVDLTSIQSPKLTFRVAYAQKSADNFDQLKVLISKDCGETWNTRMTKGGSDLVTASPINSAYVPVGQSEWKEHSVILLPFSNFNSVLFKFQFISDNGNNIYMDNINISGVDLVEQLDDIVVDVFPNPTDRFVNFKLKSGIEAKEISMVNLLGKSVYLEGENHTGKIDVSAFEKGVYILRIETTEGLVQRKIFVY